MKLSAIINFCVALLAMALIVVGENPIAGILNKMANKGQSIDRIFKPSKRGFLGDGAFGVVYKGILLLNDMEVAMKFTLSKIEADREYKIYTYLNAINNPNVEAFGVPAIYYFGKWNNYAMLAMTLLDNTFNNKFNNRKFTKIDFLIAVRDYVRITKYIHSRSVFQQDFKLSHMMYRKHMGFLCDFNVATYGKNYSREKKLLAVQNDWKQFFAIMYLVSSKHRDWLELDKENKNIVWRVNYDNFIRGLFQDSETPEKFSGMRKIFIDFAKYTFGDIDEILEIPFYDLLYQMVVEEIAKLERELNVPAVPSWLPTQDKDAAVLAKDSIPSISDIRNPLGLDEIEFKEVNFEFFNEFYHDKLTAEPAPAPEQKSRNSGLMFWKK